MAAELDESEEEAGCCNGERFGRHQIHCLRNKMASKCGKVRHLEALLVQLEAKQGRAGG